MQVNVCYAQIDADGDAEDACDDCVVRYLNRQSWRLIILDVVVGIFGGFVNAESF